jgi:BED zinc finger
MSSPIESIGGTATPTNEPDLLSEGESVDLSDEVRDTIDVLAENDEEPTVHGRKRKGKTSEVWQYFIEVEVMEKGNMVKKVKCLYCKKEYMSVIGGPTSTLKRHIQTCGYIKRAKEKKKGLITLGSCGSDNVAELTSGGGYDQMKCREIIAKMIIAHELPFSFVEYHWFNQLLKYNNPLYQKVSRAIITRDCIKVIEVEREKMKQIFKNVDMISLTSDCWTSNQTIGYMCLTAHFVDSDWKMQKRIIGFNELAPPHSGEVISDGILECLIK